MRVGSVCGTGANGVLDGAKNEACFSSPHGMCLATETETKTGADSNSLLVIDGHTRIRRVHLSDGARVNTYFDLTNVMVEPWSICADPTNPARILSVEQAVFGIWMVKPRRHSLVESAVGVQTAVQQRQNSLAFPVSPSPLEVTRCMHVNTVIIESDRSTSKPAVSKRSPDVMQSVQWTVTVVIIESDRSTSKPAVSKRSPDVMQSVQWTVTVVARSFIIRCRSALIDTRIPNRNQYCV